MTDANYKYRWESLGIPPNVTSFKFKVKAADDVHIDLSAAKMNLLNFYEMGKWHVSHLVSPIYLLNHDSRLFVRFAYTFDDLLDSKNYRQNPDATEESLASVCRLAHWLEQHIWPRLVT